MCHMEDTTMTNQTTRETMCEWAECSAAATTSITYGPRALRAMRGLYFPPKPETMNLCGDCATVAEEEVAHWDVQGAKEGLGTDGRDEE